MDWGRVLDIVRICVPVFGLIGVGYMIRVRNLASRETLRFINNLCFFVALPALIFSAVVVRSLDSLLNLPIISGTLAGVAAAAAYGLAAGALGRQRGGVAAIMAFGTFWGNVSYIGFPLAENAFGAEGLALAAVVNAFTMPVFVMGGFGFITLFARERGEDAPALRMRDMVMNPVVGAAVGAIGVVVLRDLAGLAARDDMVSRGAMMVSGIVLAFIKLTGTMGLPLALISVGASLEKAPAAEHRVPMAATALGKLAVAPLATFLFIRWMFPDAPAKVLGVAVLLMAGPNAVGSYVVCARLHVEDRFMGNLLVLTTVLSVLSIPAWLYFIL